VLVLGFVGLSVWLPWHEEQRVVALITNRRGSVETECPCPELLQRFFGDEITGRMKVFERVTLVQLNCTAITDAEIGELSRLTNLRQIYLGWTAVTDLGLAQLNRLQKLERLSLRETRVGDAGLSHLRGLRTLRDVVLDRTRISDAGLTHLSQCTNL